MNRILASAVALATISAALSAQCGNFAAPGTLIGTGDDTFFATHYPLGFTFTMAGSAGTTQWTHFRASTNGLVVLTDGVTSTGVPTGYGSVTANSTSSLYGPAGSNPRLAPYWGDLDLLVANGAGLYYDNTSAAGVSTRITWVNAVDWSNTVQKSFQLEIFASGEVKFHYSPGMTNNSGGTKYVGVSAANGTAVQTAVDLVPGPANTTGGAMHQTFPTLGSADIGGRTLHLIPGGAGWTEVVTCAYLAASHTSYGSGCYTISDSAYQLLADAAIAAPALTGNSVTFTPAGATYLMTYGGGAFLTPGGGAVNLFASATDDGEVVVTPSLPVPTAQGPQASIRVHSNGVISWGGVAQTFPGTNNYTPTAAGFLGAVNPGIWFWHDYNEQELGSGRIVREEVTVGPDTVLVLTWNNVENYASPEVANPSTAQAQVNLTTGAVKLVFATVDGNASSTFGSGHLVGYSPGGASANAGSLNLATALPLLIPTTNLAPMSLSAAPAPVSTVGSGTLVTYTQSNIPEAAPTSGVYLGLTIISLGQDLPGTDLGFLGMPGCSLHVASLDVTLAFVGATNSLTTQFQVPAGVPYGFQFFAQSAALIQPNSLPNSQNAFGATLSNAVASFVSTL
jgi:hypothetical protein